MARKPSNPAGENVETVGEVPAGPGDQALPVEAEVAAGDERHRRIAGIAFFFAEQRGFTPGYELADWLAAEAIIDRGVDDNVDLTA